jgi:hypothetical protein
MTGLDAPPWTPPSAVEVRCATKIEEFKILVSNYKWWLAEDK